VYDKEESGGIMEKGWVKEKALGFVVVRDTATAMVCMRLVNRNVEEHFWAFLKTKSTSLTSGCTSLSIAPFLGKAPLFSAKESWNWGLSASHR
jgi:hypothetical protein